MADTESKRLLCFCRGYMMRAPRSPSLKPSCYCRATVGLLSVPDIQSTSRAAGIVSVFASMGSMITGVFCLWRHQTNVKQSQSVRSFDFRDQHVSDDITPSSRIYTTPIMAPLGYMAMPCSSAYHPSYLFGASFHLQSALLHTQLRAWWESQAQENGTPL